MWQDRPGRCAADEVRRHACLRIEARLRFVADHLDGADQPDAADVADQRVIRVAADARLHPRTDAPHAPTMSRSS
jgi:hypothetical protein